MKKSPRKSTMFSFGVALIDSPERVRFLTYVDQLEAKHAPHTTVLTWLRNQQKWGRASLDFRATFLVKHGNDRIYAAPSGQVHVSGDTGKWSETIGMEGRSPKTHGLIRDIAIVGSDAVAVGMGRQVYHRQNRIWVPIDEGVLHTPNKTEVRGFNSLAGASAADLLAVGWFGELWWRCSGDWQALDSPTNVTLNTVVRLDDGSYAAAGQNGMVVHVSADGAHCSAEPVIEEEIYGATLFDGKVYFATEETILCWLPGQEAEEVKVDIPDFSTGFLCADHGMLVSVGTKTLAWSDDGRYWTDIT